MALHKIYLRMTTGSDTWQIHATRGFTALCLHTRNSLTALIDCLYTAQASSVGRTVCREKQDLKEPEVQLNNAQTYLFTTIYANRPMTHDTLIYLWEILCLYNLNPQTRKRMKTLPQSALNQLCDSYRHKGEDISIYDFLLFWEKHYQLRPWNDWTYTKSHVK